MSPVTRFLCHIVPVLLFVLFDTPAFLPIRNALTKTWDRSIGLNSVPKNAAESPLAFLHHASPSRLLYSLMIVENLFDRDLMREEGMAGPGTDMAAQLALEGAIEQRNHAYDLDSAESVIGPRRDAVAAVARRPQRGFEGDDWEDFPLDCGRIHIHTGNRTWRERFVRSGGINTLVELLLARDWDVARTGAGGGEGTVGISLAWLALLLVLLERFMDGGFLPQPKQLRQLVGKAGVKLCVWCSFTWNEVDWVLFDIYCCNGDFRWGLGNSRRHLDMALVIVVHRFLRLLKTERCVALNKTYAYLVFCQVLPIPIFFS